MGEENVSTIAKSTEAILQKKSDRILGIRHVQALLLFLCMAILYMVRVTMSVCIVAMTTTTNSSAPTFDWSAQLQSVILSSFFWGYVILQIPGGELAAKFGGKSPITICLVVNGLTSMTVPTFAYYTGWQGVCACRVLQGLTQGFLFPSSHNILGKWIPPAEKSKICTLIYIGPYFGTAIGLILAGILADTQWGWPSVFYTMGVTLFVLAVFWMLFAAKSPNESKHISADELYDIQSSLDNLGPPKKLVSPWRPILTSVPFWALVIVHCTQNWGYWTLLTEMPTYMNQVLGVDIKANGVLSAIPYVCVFLLSFPLAYTSDMSIKKKWVSVTTARKISNSIGHWGPALALIGLSYAPASSVTIAVICLSVTVGLNAGHAAGFILVHIDMSPNYAGTLMGISNCFANFTSLVAPLAVGFILHDETNVSEWRIVFFIAAAIYFIGNLIFVIFGTAETQSWNEPKVAEEDVEKKGKKTRKRSKAQHQPLALPRNSYHFSPTSSDIAFPMPCPSRALKVAVVTGIVVF